MSDFILPAIGFVLFIAMMIVTRKRKLPIAAYITATLGASGCAAFLLLGVYGYYFGTFTLYLFIVTTLIVGLVLDFSIQKLFPLQK